MRSYIAILLFLTASVSTYGQKPDTTLRMSMQVGVGWTHYYNRLIGQNPISNDHLGTSLRIMWEPEHRLSVGVETGYYKLYRVSLETGNDAHVDLSVIPVMANFRMRILKNFFITGGTGVIIMQSTVSSTGNESSSSRVISYSNVQLSGLYLYHLTPQLAVGGELKFIWIDKTNDVIHGAQAIVSWRF